MTASVQAAIEAIRSGAPVVVVGMPERRGEGTVTVAAEHCTAETVAFMATHACGIVSLCLTGERCDALRLTPMTKVNRSPYHAEFTVSIEARDGVTTGISAADRAQTIRVAIDPDTAPQDLVTPGHVLPLRARPGGVLERPAHTEAAVDLARLAGVRPAGVVCGILDADGHMAHGEALTAFAAEHGLPLLEIADLAAHRRAGERWVERVGERELDTAAGRVRAIAFREHYRELEHLALVKGDPALGPELTHVRCVAGEAFGASDCDCGAHLHRRLTALRDAEHGVLLYLDGGPPLGRSDCDPAGSSVVVAQLLGELGRAPDLTTAREER